MNKLYSFVYLNFLKIVIIVYYSIPTFYFIYIFNIDFFLSNVYLNMNNYIINQTQYDIAKQLGLKIKSSTRKNKKIDVYIKDKNRDWKYYKSIGALGYHDYYSYLENDKDLAFKKRKNYHNRMQHHPDYDING